MRFEYLVVQLCVPGQSEQNTGIFLWDAQSQQLLWEFAELPANSLDPAIREAISGLSGILADQLQYQSPKEILAWIEETWSNVLRVSNRQPIEAASADAALEELMREHIPKH